MKFSAKLAQAMAQKGFSPSDLTRLMGGVRGSRKDAVYAWLEEDPKKCRVPAVPLMLKLSRLLEVPLEYLVDDAMDEVPRPMGDGLTEGERRIVWLMRSLNLTAEEAARRLATGVAIQAGGGTAQVVAQRDEGEAARREEKGKGRLGFELEGDPEASGGEGGPTFSRRGR